MTDSTPISNKIIVWMQMSLDGKANGPAGEFDWPMVGDELHTHFVNTLRRAGMFCYGGSVYQMMAGYWPIADQLPDSTPNQAAFAEIWRPMPKLVFSRSLDTHDWNSTVSSDFDAIRDFAAAADGDTYVFGGATIVAELAQRDLIDEYQLFVHPIVLGAGTQLFPTLPERQPMTLAGSRVFDDRVIGMRYVRSR